MADTAPAAHIACLGHGRVWCGEPLASGEAAIGGTVPTAGPTVWTVSVTAAGAAAAAGARASAGALLRIRSRAVKKETAARIRDGWSIDRGGHATRQSVWNDIQPQRMVHGNNAIRNTHEQDKHCPLLDCLLLVGS